MSKKEISSEDKKAKNEKRKKIASIVVFAMGLVVLIIGAVFLILNLISDKTADAEFLVSKENWTLENENGVVWDFTEVGKGTLTTNNHTNDYDFTWVIEDDKLKIKTDWLYEMDDEYEYSLDKAAGVLILKDGEEEIRFIAK